ncbi:MAG TPA: DUF1918 domain-containing protein [Actinomycetes bacterium]|nr:DUF1918 domain-containing protein [Actinomycetes bacterium]
MHASVGEKLVLHANHVGEPDRLGEILEVRGTDGGPPFLVKFDDGHEGLVFPGPDAEVKHRPGKQ